MGHADASKKATSQELLIGGKDGKERKATSPEEMVRVIILNTEQNIFTGNIEYTRALIAAYQALIAAYQAEKNTVATLGPACAGLLKRAEEAEEKVRALEIQVAVFEALAYPKQIADLEARLAKVPAEGEVSEQLDEPVPEEVIAAANVEVGLNPLEQGLDSVEIPSLPPEGSV